MGSRLGGGGSSDHMVFQSSVVFVVVSHFLACPTHPPYVCFVSRLSIFEVVL